MSSSVLIVAILLRDLITTVRRYQQHQGEHFIFLMGRHQLFDIIEAIFYVVFKKPFLVYCFLCNFEIFEFSSTSKCHDTIIKDSLFRELFGSEYTSDTPFMHGNVWPDQFESSLEDAKVFLAETGADVSNVGPL